MAAPSSEVPELTEEELALIVREAFARWTAVSPGAAAALADVHVTIGDLPDGDLPVLGVQNGNSVLIDVNAGGFGWFVDVTPGDDSEFAATADPDYFAPASKEQLKAQLVRRLQKLGYAVTVEAPAA